MILSQGAEAIIERVGDKVCKRRIRKSYRHSDIDDSIRRTRTKREIKVLKKAKDLGVNVPVVYPDDDEFTITMDYIDAIRLRNILLEDPTKKTYLKTVGGWLAILHENNIIHGDLTTSNVLVSKDSLFLIDFGLSFFSTRLEDRAVDVHLIKQAIESTHYQFVTEFFDEFLQGYLNYDQSAEVLKRLEQVEARGRNKIH